MTGFNSKQLAEMQDWEGVAADQALTIAMMQLEQEMPHSEIYQNSGKEEYLSKAYRLANELRCHLAVAPAPKREWVGLTEDEIDALHMEIKVRLMGTFDTKDIYRVVDAKLKEKNT